MNAKTERNRSATRIHRGGKHLENRSREKPLRKRIHAGLARNEATKGYAERGIPAQDSPQYAVGTTDEPRAEVWRGLPRSTGRETGRNESGLLFRQSRFFDAGADLFPAGPGRNAFENEQAGAANLLADTRMGQIARRTNAGPMLFIETTGRLRFGISFTIAAPGSHSTAMQPTPPYRHKRTCGRRSCRRASSRRTGSAPRSAEARGSNRGTREQSITSGFPARSKRVRRPNRPRIVRPKASFRAAVVPQKDAAAEGCIGYGPLHRGTRGRPRSSPPGKDNA